MSQDMKIQSAHAVHGNSHLWKTMHRSSQDVGLNRPLLLTSAGPTECSRIIPSCAVREADELVSARFDMEIGQFSLTIPLIRRSTTSDISQPLSCFSTVQTVSSAQKEGMISHCEYSRSICLLLLVCIQSVHHQTASKLFQ